MLLQGEISAAVFNGFQKKMAIVTSKNKLTR